MNIDIYTSDESREKYIKIDACNPAESDILDMLMNHNIDGIWYTNKYIISNDNNIHLPLPCLNESNNTYYILLNFTKKLSDIITNITCNYKIALLQRGVEILLTPNITIPIICMIYNSLKFKIYFKNKQDYDSAIIVLQYDSLTLSNTALKLFSNNLKKYKWVINNMGHIIENGVLSDVFNLD